MDDASLLICVCRAGIIRLFLGNVVSLHRNEIKTTNLTRDQALNTVSHGAVSKERLVEVMVMGFEI